MKVDRIIFATGNAGKMKEIRMILSDLGLEIQSMKEAGVDIDIVEDGKHLKKMRLSRHQPLQRSLRNGM